MFVAPVSVFIHACVDTHTCMSQLSFMALLQRCGNAIGPATGNWCKRRSSRSAHTSCRPSTRHCQSRSRKRCDDSRISFVGSYNFVLADKRTTCNTWQVSAPDYSKTDWVHVQALDGSYRTSDGVLVQLCASRSAERKWFGDDVNHNSGVAVRKAVSRLSFAQLEKLEIPHAAVLSMEDIFCKDEPHSCFKTANWFYPWCVCFFGSFCWC